MFKLVKKLLHSSEHKIQKNNSMEDQSKPPCSIEIQMNADGTINIICSWPEFDQNNKKAMTYLADNYALMIDALNSGFLSSEIINTLKNHVTDNPYDTLFAQNVFYKMAELNYIKNHQNNHDPVVRPSQAFNKS